MRRVIAVILCILLLATTVYATNAVNAVNTTAVVNSDGSCKITIKATVYLDEPNGKLTLPLGTNVSAVTVNGALADTVQYGGVTSVNLSNVLNQVGSITFTIQYTAENVLTTNSNGSRVVTVPLLHGFPYPVQRMSFTVTLPTEFDTLPSFYSGYHGQDIERRMTASVNGNTITGTVNEVLKDSETMYLELIAPDGMFPAVQTIGGTLGMDAVAMGICMVLAMLFWIKTMGCLPRISRRRAMPPDSVSPGILGSYLVHSTADLNLMVVGWAQLGYLIIQLDGNGRVLLHKKMEMGNERSAFEQRCFKNLFGKGDQTDATGYRYTMLWERAERLSQRFAAGYRSGSGNARLFRLIACTPAVFAGIALGDSIATNASWRIVLMAAGALLMSILSWHIQGGMYELHLRGKARMKLSMICCGLALIAGLCCGCLSYTVALVVWELFAGLCAAYGGKRTENGVRIYKEILGLRRHMRKMQPDELKHIQKTNPGYYYELAPYALALGVDKQFAAKFGRREQPMCTWLVSTVTTPRTASEWYLLLRKTVDAMNREQKRPKWEQILDPK